MKITRIIWKTSITAILALAVLTLGACQSSTPEATQSAPTRTSEIAIQHTATPNVSASTPTSANTPDVSVSTPTPTSTPVATATSATTASPVPTATATSAPSPSPTRTPMSSQEGPSVVISDVRFLAEIANTPALRTTGLSYRPSLPLQTGMLFIFESGIASNFWMKEMRFPLDFVWVGADCTVLDITENVPFPDSQSSPLPLYASGQPAAFNFEINGGEAKAKGLAIGDKVRFNGIDVEGAHC